MSTYAVGDVQGCLSALMCLLDQAAFDPDKDKLWFAGDLVNRGPQSLQTLRFIHSLGTAAIVVLGNHDLHLLAIALGEHKARKKDTFDAILKAKDRDQLLHWLRQQKLMHCDKQLGYLLVHAGIPPIWNSEQALSYAREVEKIIRGDNLVTYLAAMYGDTPNTWNESLQGPERWRLITNYLTRMRFCDAGGKLELQSKLGPDSAPKGYKPWFTLPNHLNDNETILFGHWAALEGKTNKPNIIALDTGCVWGRQLSMLRLNDKQWFRCDC